MTAGRRESPPAAGRTAPGTARFEEALRSVAPPLPNSAPEKLLVLFHLLQEWKRAGITGFSDPAALARLYFLEALALRPHLPAAGRCLDVGSGGGTPALPLALAGVGSAWTLLEPRRLAASFLEIAARETGIADRITVRRETLHQFLSSTEGTAETGRVRAVTLRAVRLRRVEWRGLARTLPAGARVIWPTSRQGRERAAIPPGAYREEQLPAERGIVWIGHVSRETSAPGRGANPVLRSERAP